MRPYMAMEFSSPKMPNRWSPWIWVMKMASIFRNARCALLSCCCVPSPQSIRNKRPCTERTWALGFLSEMGMAEAVPIILRVKFMSELFCFLLELLLEGCEGVDVAESGLLDAGIDLLHRLLGVLGLYGCSLLLGL